MKKKLLLIFCLLMALKGFSQEDSHGIGDKIFLPSLDLGYVHTNSKFLSDGLLIKTSLEFRLKNPSGFFFRLNYDTYNTSYEFNNVLDFSNVIKGTVAFSDLIAGVGYRWSIGDNFRVFAILQPGVTFYDFPNAILDGNNILVSQDGKSIFTSRATLGLEYYINPKSALTFDIFQSQVWRKEDFWTSNQGAYGLAIGFVTALF